ncbi:MAG: ribonuclease P protein component [Bacteroidales bacterium]|jgi:ribonuclease P protein component|nr:ribonuclease P protein component [Bacteroidales bacterium]
MLSEKDSPHRHFFSKQERLCSKKAIVFLLKQKSLFVYPFKCYFHFLKKTENQDITKICITVPKHRFKLAVDRNRIKRQTREAYRLNKEILYSDARMSDWVGELLFVYIGKEKPTYLQIEKSMVSLLTQLERKR